MTLRLRPEDQALWDRVAATVRPLPGRAVVPAPVPPEAVPSPSRSRPPPTKVTSPSRSAGTLDARWDRALRRGAVVPDRVIDLHGHSLASAHAALDHGLEQALAAGSRLVLLVTGRPPREGSRRGVIHGSVGDWLRLSRHARRIAAVRGAHPRHGGHGAFYIVLRRERAGS